MKIKEDIETEKNQEEQNLDDNMKLIKNLLILSYRYCQIL